MIEPLKIFIGYDPAESEAFHVCVHSIMKHASKPVSIIPLNVRNLRDIYSRDMESKQSNEFTYTRFLVPYLCGFQGKAMFMDCDMILRSDVYELFAEVDERYAVSVVKHDYEPKTETKYLGNVQYKYPRKNWASVMLFNCAHPDCRNLKPYTINTADARYLLRFGWCPDSAIGDLSPVWNFLVGEYDRKKFEHEYGPVRLVHWTIGGPYFDEYKDVDFSCEYRELREEALFTMQLEKPKKRGSKKAS